MALHDPPIEIPFIDVETGMITRPWQEWLIIAKRDKANRVEDATADNIALLDSDGHPVDSNAAIPAAELVGTTATQELSNKTFEELVDNKILASDGSGGLSEEDLDDWVSGTANQITVTDDGDGTITLSTPQDIATTSSPTFVKVLQTAPYHVYGGFQNEAETISISAVDTWTMITNGTNDLWTGTEAIGFSLSSDVMTITNTGDYAGQLSMSLSGLNSKDFQIRVYNITQTRQESYLQGITTTGANNYVNVSLPLYIEATASDQLRMEVQCTTDASDPVFKHAVFYLHYLHE